MQSSAETDIQRARSDAGTEIAQLKMTLTTLPYELESERAGRGDALRKAATAGTSAN